jgi:outer membrane protein, multidrug efflux system
MNGKRRLGPGIAVLITAAVLSSAAAAASRPPRARLPTVYDAAGEVGVVMAPAALDHWWTLFGDPTLDALEEQALTGAPDARTAAARILEAKATRDSEIAQTLPTGEITGKASKSYQRNVGSAGNSLFPVGGDYESETIDLPVSWEIDLFGRLREARRVARANNAISRFDVEASLASLAAGVADNYFLAGGLVTSIEDAQQTVKIQTELQAVAEERAKLGLGAVSDADRVAGDLAQAKARLEDLQFQYHAARRQLLILIGRGSESVDSLRVPAQAADAPPAPAAIPGDLLARRPDVREAEQRLRAEAGTARLRHLAIFPTFTFLPQLGLSRMVQPSVSYNPTTNTLSPYQQATSLGYWTWAGGVTVPLLDIPQLLFDAKAEDARAEQAAVAYEKSVQTAFGEAENALVGLAASRRAAAQLTDGELRARRAYDAAQTRYAMGLDDLTTALSAEEAWRTTRLALTTQRVQTLRRAVATYKALGGGWAYSTTLAKAR